ncbi:hypothetical protein MNB_SM-4-1783 [hydrothermal vent metagenome]|uniref:Serine protease n=1 Tax=hydrothermal vent metagenome TaxID=652676 RepID=A0A1W1C9S0_9ZZZZ
MKFIDKKSIVVICAVLLLSGCGNPENTENIAETKTSKIDTNRSKINKVNLAQLALSEGKTPLEYLEDEFNKKRPSSFVLEDQKVFDPWSDANRSLIHFSKDNWTSQFDFTGVAWNSIKAGTLVTNQHILVAAHFARAVGEEVRFYTKEGKEVVRTIVALKTLEQYDNRISDSCIEKLNAPVPNSIKVYSIINAEGLDDFSSLNGSPLILTDQRRKAYVDVIPSFNGTALLMNFAKYNKVSTLMYHKIIGGDSGGPIFSVVDGELVIVALVNHYTSGDFLAYDPIYNALVQAIADMENK